MFNAVGRCEIFAKFSFAQTGQIRHNEKKKVRTEVSFVEMKKGGPL